MASAACSAIRFGSEKPAVPPPALAGPWTGAWIVEGQRFDGSLVVRQSGADLTATFDSRGLGGEATGKGKVESDGSVRLELRYRTTCAGTAQLRGTVSDQGSRLGGALTASDCTGKANGTFSFTR